MRPRRAAIKPPAGHIPPVNGFSVVVEKRKRLASCQFRSSIHSSHRWGSGENGVNLPCALQLIDFHNLDLRALKKSCIHFAQPDGRLVPFESYNLFYRDRNIERTKLLQAEIAMHTARICSEHAGKVKLPETSGERLEFSQNYELIQRCDINRLALRPLDTRRAVAISTPKFT